MFSAGLCRGVVRRTIGARLERSVGYSSDSNEVRVETDQSALLEAATRERLVKTQQTEKLSACCSDL
jgi:hypothetical protein